MFQLCADIILSQLKEQFHAFGYLSTYLFPVLATATQLPGPVNSLLSHGRCRNGFVEFEQRCYRLESTKASQLVQLPEDLCPMRVAPHTFSEAAFMRSLLRNSTELRPMGDDDYRVWIGLSFKYDPSSAPSVRRAFCNLQQSTFFCLEACAKCRNCSVDCTAPIFVLSVFGVRNDVETRRVFLVHHNSNELNCLQLFLDSLSFLFVRTSHVDC